MRRRPAIERAVALRPSCGQCVSMLASTSSVVDAAQQALELGRPRHVAVAQRHGSLGCQIAVLEMDRRDAAAPAMAMSSSLGRSPVAQALAMSTSGRQIDNGFLVRCPGDPPALLLLLASASTFSSTAPRPSRAPACLLDSSSAVFLACLRPSGRKKSRARRYCRCCRPVRSRAGWKCRSGWRGS